MPNTTPAELHRIADLKHRIARAQINRHEDDIVAGYGRNGEVPDMTFDQFVKANRLQKLDHDRVLAQQARLAQALGQPSADTVVDAANAHIEKMFAQNARAEQLKADGATAQAGESSKQANALAAALASGAAGEQ